MYPAAERITTPAIAIYELLPAFIFSCICIVVVSLLTRAPSREIEEDFEAVRTGNVQDA